MEAIRRLISGPSQQEQVRTWQQSLRREGRQLDRQLSSMVTAESRTKLQIKVMAKRGDTTNCRLLAQELVRSRRARNRLETSKAQLNSLGMQLNEQLATIKITGTLQKSSQMMHEVNSLIRLPELSVIMGKLQGEMMKAGLLDEMISETLDSTLETELEDDAELEVEQILTDILGTQLGGSQKAPQSKLPELGQIDEDAVDMQSEDEATLNNMRSRLAALKE